MIIICLWGKRDNFRVLWFGWFISARIGRSSDVFVGIFGGKDRENG